MRSAREPFGAILTPRPAKGQKIEKFMGRVAAVNPQESTLAVQSIKPGMTFDVKSAKLKGYDAIGNIKEGDRVTVHAIKKPHMKCGFFIFTIFLSAASRTAAACT